MSWYDDEELTMGNYDMESTSFELIEEGSDPWDDDNYGSINAYESCTYGSIDWED